MTKKYPLAYFVKKTLTKTANAKLWAKDGKGKSPAREEILEAIKQRVLAKKKKH